MARKKISINSVDKQVRDKLTKEIRRNLYRSKSRLRKESKERFGFLFEVPIYVQDPMVAEYEPATGIQEIEVSWEPGLSDGPTNSRFAVVDYNSDTGKLVPPAKWNAKGWVFEGVDGQPLTADDPSSYQFHQVNAWATVQRVLDFYESPWALGRPIPWGFEGNRLIIVPHAGLGKNAFYDRKSKSLQFYYFGSEAEPRFTCLSHDIVAHETGHAVLDGIRPHYLDLSSIETAAFHEFIGDLTAILLALDNIDVRHHVANVSGADLTKDTTISALAEEFGQYLEGRKFLRSANKPLTMPDIAGSTSAHHNSQVLTTAMFRILTRMAQEYTKENERRRKVGEKEVTAFQALYWAYSSFRRISLQPLDLCPPADVRFIDYARAVLHNDRLTNREDKKDYRKIIAEVFHEWGLCQKTEAEHEAGKCDLDYRNPLHQGDLIVADIGSIARSRTSAYHFLDDNRDDLLIPHNQDIVVADLYDTNKYDAAANRLPREIVLEYLWREPVVLAGAEFKQFEGQSVPLLCGGTIVFDGRGNIISWFRKPGTEVAADRAEGKRRIGDLLHAVRARINAGHLTFADDASDAAGVQSPALARVVDGTLRIEIAPHIRQISEELEEEIWTTSL